jgi:transcriptional repressor NrdR
MIQLEAIADRAELLAQESPVREVSAEALGETVMKELKRLDKVAYVRFASVYLDFKDVQEFMSELQDLLKGRD